MKLTNQQISTYESQFGAMENLALEQRKASLKMKLVDPNEAASLMNDANSLATDAAQGRAELKRQVIAYTPEETSAKDIILPLVYSNKEAADASVENFQATNEALAEKGSFVSVPTLPLARVGTEGTYKETKAWGPDEWLVNQVGKTVVPLMDSVFKNTLKAGGQTLSNIIPDEIETSAMEAMKGAYYDISRQEWYKKATGWLEEGLVEPYMSWKKKNPERAKLTEDAIATTGMVLDRTNLSAAARRSGTRIVLSGAQGAKVQRRAFIQDMLAPAKPDSVNNPNKWTDDGSGKAAFVPDVLEQQAIHEVTLIPDLNPAATPVTNRAKIQKQYETLSNRLTKVIIDAGNPRYSRDNLNAVVAGHIDDLVESTQFRAASGSAAGVPALIEHMGTMVARSNNDALGLLELRREFDDFIKNDVKLSDLGPEAKTSLERVVLNVRNTLNAELDAIVPDAPTKRLRLRVSSLKTADEMIRPKADANAASLFARLNEGIYFDKVGARLPTTATGLYFTGALTAGAVGSTYGLPILAAAGGLYGVKKAIDVLRNPTVRKKAGQAIIGMSKAIKSATDPIEIAIMRGDRATLLQLLSESASIENEEK